MPLPEACRPSLEFPKAWLKELPTIGHKVGRFLATRSHWRREAAKAALVDPPRWLLEPGGSAPGDPTEDGLFACSFSVGEHLRLDQLMVSQESATHLGHLWQRHDPGAPQSLPPALSPPADANAPVWLALLRLRPLRQFWDRELRRSTVDSLLGLLPDAWVLDPAALPPGAVIPRLEITAWADLPRLRNSGRAFAIVAADGAGEAVPLDEALPAEAWTAAIRWALDQFPAAPRVLVERDGHARPVPGTQIVGFYEKKADRTEGLGTMCLVPDAAGQLQPARLRAAHRQRGD